MPKPCAHCGGEARVQTAVHPPHTIDGLSLPGEAQAMIVCQACHSQTRWHSVTTGGRMPTDRDVSGAEQLATAAWDRRVDGHSVTG